MDAQWRQERVPIRGREVGSYFRLSLLFCLLACRTAQRGSELLALEIAGCEDVYQDLQGSYVCTYTPEMEQSGSGQAPARARIRAAIAGSAISCWQTEGAKGAEVVASSDGSATITLPLGRAQVLWTAWSQRLHRGSPHELRLRLEPAVELNVIDRVSRLRRAGTPVEALAELDQALERGDARDPAVRARLLNEKGDVLTDLGRSWQAMDSFAESAKLARQSRRLSTAANSARRYASLIAQNTRDLDAAERVLDEYDAAIGIIPFERATTLYDRGLIAQRRGQLSRAHTLLLQAKLAAELLPYGELRRYSLVADALTLQLQGMTESAEEVIGELTSELARPDLNLEDACSRTRYYDTLAWTRLLAHEANAPQARDPRALLALAEQAAKADRCLSILVATNHLANRARAEFIVAKRMAERESAAGHGTQLLGITGEIASLLRAARSRLSQARSLSPTLGVPILLDSQELTGRMALLERRPLDALRSLYELEATARRAQEPDYLWRALVDQALALTVLSRSVHGPMVTEYAAAARAAFENAETHLDARVGSVPLSAERRGFLPRFAEGTAAFLEFLLSQREDQKALAVMRHAHVRGLFANLDSDVLAALPEPSRSELTRERDAILELRAEQRKLEMKGGGESHPAQDEVLRRLDGFVRRLSQAAPGPLELRPLQRGEVMHICHSLPRERLVCMMADAAGNVLSTTFSLSELAAASRAADAPHQRSRLLLQPFAQLLRDARVVRIIPHSRLRDVEFAALPWSDEGHAGYLASSVRAVVYALDLKLSRNVLTPAPGRALLLSNLWLKTQPLEAPKLYRQLAQLGWVVTPFSNLRFERGRTLDRVLRCWLGIERCSRPLDIPVDSEPGTAGAVLPMLPRVELAHLHTHAHYGKDSGWASAIRMPDDSQLTVGDLLTLARAPRWTLLMACQGGAAGEGAASDDISLAQVLLLRGGEVVVASTNPLDDEVAAQWTQALYSARAPAPGSRPYLSASSPDLLQAFFVAQESLRNQAGTPGAWHALRVFVP